MTDEGRHDVSDSPKAWFVALLGALMIISCVVFQVAETAEQASPSKAVDDVVVLSDVAVPIRNGYNLRADVYLPGKNGAILPGRFGTLLSRTPYDKSSPGTVALARLYASMGYAVVIQDESGRGRSEGHEFKYAH